MFYEYNFFLFVDSIPLNRSNLFEKKFRFDKRGILYSIDENKINSLDHHHTASLSHLLALVCAYVCAFLDCD